MVLVSVVSPVYRTGENLITFVKRVDKILSTRKIRYELILVDDGCPMDSWKDIEKCVEINNSVQGIKLSRNFGQHMAITAGLEFSRGEKIVVMDSDLQEKPEEMIRLIEKSEEGYDIVYTRKKNREHSLFKNVTASLYSNIMTFLSDTGGGKKYDPYIGTMSLISRKVLNELLKIQDKHRHYIMLLRWLGFRETTIDVEHEKRIHGKTSYSFSKLLNHAIDGLVSQSVKFLRYSIFLGLLFVFVASLAVIVTVYFSLVYGFKEGWASIFVTIVGSTGLILFFLGVNGLYIGKTFEESRDRPLFVVDKILKKEQP